MKKIFFVFLFLCIPLHSYGELEVFLSSQDLLYGEEIWTSHNYPDIGAESIKIKRSFYREEFPSEYEMTESEIKGEIDGLFPALNNSEKQARYNSLIDFDDNRLKEYIAISVSSDTQSIINEKDAVGIILSPFESVFQACSIDLSDRQALAAQLVEDIFDGLYVDTEHFSYSNPRYGDCIIPFPDISRSSSIIADSFESNKRIAQSLGGNYLDFGALEDSVNIFSLSDIVLGSSYSGVQDNNILDLRSTRVDGDVLFDKEVGKSKALYVHQNHLKNIYIDSHISGNSTIGFTVGGSSYTVSHPLFIRSSDSETKRTLSGWQEIEPGIYSKTLIQEDTFLQVGGVYVPKQNVGVTTYYAVFYNYDTTPPLCPNTLFSHENSGIQNFILPEYPWFSQKKYGYFVCLDEESGCSCDDSAVGCFLRDERVLSIPQEIGHSGIFNYRFWNNVGLSTVCESVIEQDFFYDTISPDIHFSFPGIIESSLEKEYVRNAGALYDGEQIVGKRFYHIKNNLEFKADENLDIQLELYDFYEASDSSQGVSGLDSYKISISKFEGDNWVEKIVEEEDFPQYNPEGTKTIQDTHIINFQSLTDVQDVFTKIGRYQVYLYIRDAAGNQSRITFYFDITPGDVDITHSTLISPVKNAIYANHSDGYKYSLSLKDQYFNVISGVSIGDVVHSCVGVTPCNELKLDMTTSIPIGDNALEIYDIDSVSDVDGIVDFSVRSYSPGVFSESFMFEIGNPTQRLHFVSGTNVFLAPIVGTLETKISGNWESNAILVNQISEYRITIEDIQGLGYVWNNSDFSSYLSGRHPDTNFVLSTPIIKGADGIYFSGNFISNLSQGEEHKTLLEISDGNTSGVNISYLLDGETVRYRLSPDSLSSGILELSNSGELENPVKIIGNLQGVGNTHNEGERQNTTDLDTSISRKILRENIGRNTKNRIDDTIIGGVKYIDKTNDINKSYVLESNPNFETLVVRNGNILITSDFNTTGKMVGLVSYLDAGYNKQTGFQEVGNIYIAPNVVSIKAILYADGGLISTTSGNPVSSDISTRNLTLQNQLSIYGSIFTRNTLAGGRELTGNYMLPGGKMTNNQDLAVQYDLYYLRRGNNGCTQDAYGFCDNNEYLFIEYDPRIISSPPEFFQAE